MTIIPTEARATMAAYREGRDLAGFLDDMWKRRATEHPGKTVSTASYPIQFKVPAKRPLTEPVPANVTQMAGKKRANG